ncbi:putative acyltransferase [Methylophaga frappieri]|uniref:Putative acyltransferase n=1 Tax=Methylophaga frappieri (strain ATCC BAA-2434 / DSM 25690 / JAM7) TaxID=754477 RepID=I1YKJ0_METFJ|nr:acyltransferase [Methylophaga frappieri]AFJ03433.1 putative acyltransferase [Methylophaga frappieri]
MGYLRLFLAWLVLLSHINWRVDGLNPGVFAVVIFYLLAGSVVTHLWHDVMTPGPGKLRRFYQDRFLRIYPMYAYAMLLTLLFLLYTGFGQPQYQPLALFNNLIMIPLNYYMVIDSTVMTNPAWNLVPPAWSLAVEVQVYLLLPFLLLRPAWAGLAFVASLIVYMLANLSLIQPDYFGYRLLPGVLFIFLLGSILQRAQQQPRWYGFLAFFWLAMVLTYVGFAWTQQFPEAYTRETLLGVIIGLPLIAVLNHWRPRLPGNGFAGQLSYGVFVLHFLVIWGLAHWQGHHFNSWQYALVVTALTVLLALPGVLLLEKRINRWRFAHN